MAETTAAPATSAPKSAGLDPKIAGLLCWIFAPITSIIFMLMEDMKKDDFIQYHAKSSLYYGIANIVVPMILVVLFFIPVINILAGCLMWLLMIAFFAGRIYFAIKAYNGEKTKIPLISNYVK